MRATDLFAILFVVPICGFLLYVSVLFFILFLQAVFDPSSLEYSSLDDESQYARKRSNNESWGTGWSDSWGSGDGGYGGDCGGGDGGGDCGGGGDGGCGGDW